MWRPTVKQCEPKAVTCGGMLGKINVREHREFWALETDNMVLTVEKDKLARPPFISNMTGTVLLVFKTSLFRDRWIVAAQTLGSLGEINALASNKAEPRPCCDSFINELHSRPCSHSAIAERDAAKDTAECAGCYTHRMIGIGRPCNPKCEP